MRIIKIIFILNVILIFSCKKDEKNIIVKNDFVSAVDISQYPEISISNPVFKDIDGKQKDFLDILKDNGINTIRLRIWVNPTSQHSSITEVKQFSQILKLKGFKIWLTLHYSDTWADPENQETPLKWQGLSFESTKDSVYEHTKKVVQEINPDFIQIGNEINSGFLHPIGNIITNKNNFIELIKIGCLAVRQNSTQCKIILHFAGIENSNWFFDQISTVDYDIIGLSYYPIWHDKSIIDLKKKIQELSETYNKEILIAETAYPFTLEWNDWTNNIVGTNEQLILPDYPASIEGQMKFIRDIKNVVKDTPNGVGLCYWGAELIAWKGKQSTTASTWENQALFDFNLKALPSISELK